VIDDGFVRIASLAEVPDGELRAYDLEIERVAVAHVENELFAFADECTHEGCSLAEGSLDEMADTIECPCHGSRFDLRSGEPVEGPAQDPVAVHAVRVTDDGWIEVRRSAEQ
jgi:3-phenylpropionate/trans-cinnamate dioxygenase ferredoxin subunit